MCSPPLIHNTTDIDLNKNETTHDYSPTSEKSWKHFLISLIGICNGIKHVFSKICWFKNYKF
jgi:hypothetical protein